MLPKDQLQTLWLIICIQSPILSPMLNEKYQVKVITFKCRSHRTLSEHLRRFTLQLPSRKLTQSGLIIGDWTGTEVAHTKSIQVRQTQPILPTIVLFLHFRQVNSWEMPSTSILHGSNALRSGIEPQPSTFKAGTITIRTTGQSRIDWCNMHKQFWT